MQSWRSFQDFKSYQVYKSLENPKAATQLVCYILLQSHFQSNMKFFFAATLATLLATVATAVDIRSDIEYILYTLAPF
jgi:hypothetical protein